MDKLSELSKPVAWILHTRGGDVPTLDECYVANAEGMENIHSSPLYSQEYVSALLAALRNIYAACDTGERCRDGSQQGVAMPDWATVDSVRALLESIDNG
ncbi:TPA: hypothetical protein SMI16_002265 [Serratia liquefaciens]|nr:hypothetical protein [Serratia liquefaciens]